MNEKSYRSLLRFAQYKLGNKQLAEDLVHDAIITSLEKKVDSPTFIRKVFNNHRREYKRNKEIELRNNNFFYNDYINAPYNIPTNYGEALDVCKAINTITDYIKTSPKFNYRDKSKNSQNIFIEYFLWKKDSKELAKKFKTTTKSIRNLAYSIADRLREIKHIKPYMDFLDSQNYSIQKHLTTRRGASQRKSKRKSYENRTHI